MRWAVCYFKNIHKLDSSSNNISRNQYTYLKVDCVWKHLICQHQVVIGKLLNKISKMWSNLSPFSSFTLINRNMIQCILFCRLVVIYLFIYSFLFCFAVFFCSAVFSCVFSFHSVCCYSWDCFGICLYLDNKIQLPYTLIRMLYSCEWRMVFI